MHGAESLAYDLDEVANAENYNAWLLARARPYLHGRVLDFGAGIGTFTAALAAEADEVVALEPDPALRAHLAEAAPAATLVDAADHLTGAFDAIVCFNVIEHVDDDQGALKRMRDLLTPDGKALLLVPAHPFLFGSLDEAFGHHRRYTTGSLRRRLDAVGLRPLELRYVNPVGALGWLVASRIVRESRIPRGQLRVLNRSVSILRHLDRLRLPFGLSVWAVATPSG